MYPSGKLWMNRLRILDVARTTYADCHVNYAAISNITTMTLSYGDDTYFAIAFSVVTSRVLRETQRATHGDSARMQGGLRFSLEFLKRTATCRASTVKPFAAKEWLTKFRCGGDAASAERPTWRVPKWIGSR